MRRILHRVAGLPADQRRLLMEALIVSASLRAALLVLPFRRAESLACRAAGRSESLLDPWQAAWAVSTASRVVPGATCLTRAMATRVMLARHGCPSSLHLGVRKHTRTGFGAHAWVESRGRVIIGATDDLEEFTPLVAFGRDGR